MSGQQQQHMRQSQLYYTQPRTSDTLEREFVNHDPKRSYVAVQQRRDQAQIYTPHYESERTPFNQGYHTHEYGTLNQNNNQNYATDEPMYRAQHQEVANFTALVCPDLFSKALSHLPENRPYKVFYPWHNQQQQFANMEGLYTDTSMTEHELELIRKEISNVTLLEPRPCMYPFLFVLLCIIIPLVGIILAIILLAKSILLMILLIIFLIVFAIVSFYCLSQSYKTRLQKREIELGELIHHWNRKLFISRGITMKVGPFGAWIQGSIDQNQIGKPFQYDEKVLNVHRP